jgi:TM2 domain-containing membrane protein YozV/Tfp pilus assembly protein PilE
MADANDTTKPYSATKSVAEAGVGEGMIKCPGCSKDIHQLASDCPNCGFPLRSRGYKSKTISGALAMLFGAFGVHRFFLGQWWGLFYLLTFWTGIPSIISFFEAIVFWCSNVKSWDAKYNEGKPASPNERTGAGTIVLIVVIIGFIGVAIIGILAAISIPAYQDYTVRAHVNQAMVEASDYKYAINKYYQANNQLPYDLNEIGIEGNALPSGHQAELTESGFVITYVSPDNDMLNGKTIEFDAYLDDNGLAWDCTGGSMLNRHRPRTCRGSDASDGYE